MKALVTGAAGFVGSAVTRALLQADWQVRALVRRDSDRRNLERLPVETAVGDLADRASLDAAISGCTALFHVAADYRLGAFKPEQLYRTNVDGTGNVLEAARRAGVERVVYTSSVATIGLPADGSPGNEATPVALSDMVGHYKRSKFLAEQLVRDAARAGEWLPRLRAEAEGQLAPVALDVQTLELRLRVLRRSRWATWWWWRRWTELAPPSASR
jgi:dihydroflavonol-4-reductase